MEDRNSCYVHDEWQLNAYEDPTLLPPIPSAFGDTLLHPSFNPKISCVQTSSASINYESRPAKQIKTSNTTTTSCWSSPNNNTDHEIPDQPQFASSCPNLVSSVNQNYINYQMGLMGKITNNKDEIIGTNNNVVGDHHVLMSEESLENLNYGEFMTTSILDQARKINGTIISPNNNNNRVSHQPVHDHIIAERKRREKLSQKFIALSALVPGLKKMDKASVLGDAIKYMKQLQEKVRLLEEEQTKAKTVESVVIVRKSQFLPCDSSESNNSSDSSSGRGGGSSSSLPEMEARFCERSVLIRIHCEKIKGIVEKAIGVIEDLHLIVTNSNSMTFGSAALDITIIAQMDSEFCMTLEDFVVNLRSAFKSFM
ncbi:hypothetical protein K1719_028405 [Acacia pycnantha]|nr:hypothetical protein K1719_028405 [Acacia pycnantha]